jgi:RND family efflux transporter MFP subunit
MSDRTNDSDARLRELEREREHLAGERDRLQAALDASYAQLSEITSRVLAMNEAADSLVETHDVSGVASGLLDVSARAVGARTGVVFLSQGEGAFQMLAAMGYDEAGQEAIAQSLPDIAMCNLTENEGRAFDTAEAAKNEAWQEWVAETSEADPEATLTPEFELFVPLQLDERTLGVLALGPPPRGEHYGLEDRLFLEHVSSQGALALDRAMLFESNQDRLQDLDALLRISRELSSTLDVDHVMITAVNLTGAIVPRQRAVLALFDGGRLRIRAVSDYPRVDASTAERLGIEKLLQWLAFRKPEAMIVRASGVAADEAHEGRDVWQEYFQGGDMRSAYVVLLKDDQGPVGVLLLEAYDEGAFDQSSDQEAIGVLVGQLAVAIRNAELYRQLPMVSALTPLAERRRKWQRMTPAQRGRLLAGAALALLLLGVVPWPIAVGGDAQVLPANEVPVRAAVPGLVRTVLVTPGERVRAGQPIAALDPEALGARLAAQRAQADRALVEGATADQGNDPYARRRAELEREEAMARLASLERDDRRAILTAPVDGYVLTPGLKERAGALLEAGDIFCQVSSLDTLRVELGVSETDIARIRAGQALRLKVLGFPDRQFRGRVTELSWQGEAGRPGAPTVFTVSGWVDNSGARLRSGMTGRARVDVGAETVLTRVTRGIWRWLRMSFWV